MARNFDGSNDRIVTSDSTTTPSAISIAAWIYLNATTSGGILYWGPNDAGVNGTEFGIVSNKLRLRVRSGDGVADRVIDSTSTVGSGAWKHVAVTQNGPTATPVFYIDGVDAGSSVISNESPTRSTGSKFIGFGVIANAYLNGRIAGVRT